VGKTLRDLPDFAKAHKRFVTYRACPPATVERYRGLVRDIITSSWAKHGFEEIGNGFLWTVDPDDDRDVVLHLLSQLQPRPESERA
jgi:hypothetical protein